MTAPMTEPTMRTERLMIEPLGRAHAEDLFAALDDERVATYLGGPDVSTLDALVERVGLLVAGAPPNSGEEWLNWVVRHDGTIVGRVEATVTGQIAEIAYVFGPRWWGHGYATESTAWMLQHLRDTRTVTEFWATVDPENVPSIALLERLDFARVVHPTYRPSSYDDGDLIYRR